MGTDPTGGMQLITGCLADARMSILPDGVLHIRDVRNEDQMSMYTCTTRNVLTGDEKNSGFAYLRVHGQWSRSWPVPIINSHHGDCMVSRLFLINLLT